tara:strand:- start:8147 stop:9289 length:1143 start_codon:yes stop_codon:yes gene_type:complete
MSAPKELTPAANDAAKLVEERAKAMKQKMKMRQRELEDRLQSRMESSRLESSRMEAQPVLEENIGAPPPIAPKPAHPPVKPAKVDEWNVNFTDTVINIWLVGDTPTKYPPQLHGIFYTKSSYIMLIKNDTYYHLIVWIGSEVSKMDKNFVMLKAHELSTKYTNILVSVETCFKESSCITNLFNARVVLNGTFSHETHNFHGKTFKLVRNTAIEYTEELLEDVPGNYMYWGKEIVVCLSDASKQTFDAVMTMISAYNVLKCENYTYDDYTKFLNRVKNMEDKTVEYKLNFVGDDLDFKHVCTAKRINKQLLANGKIYVFEKYVNGELTESIVYETLNSPPKLATIFRTSCWEIIKAPSVHYIVEKKDVSMMNSVSLMEYII